MSMLGKTYLINRHFGFCACVCVFSCVSVNNISRPCRWEYKSQYSYEPRPSSSSLLLLFSFSLCFYYLLFNTHFLLRAKILRQKRWWHDDDDDGKSTSRVFVFITARQEYLSYMSLTLTWTGLVWDERHGKTRQGRSRFLK